MLQGLKGNSGKRLLFAHQQRLNGGETVVNINSAGQVPYATRIWASFSRLRPIQPTAKPSKPTQNCGVLIYDADRSTFTSDNNAAFAEKKASEHSAVFVAVDKEGSLSKGRGTPSTTTVKKLANSVSINPVLDSNLLGVCAIGIQCKHLIFGLVQYHWPYRRTQGHAVVNQKASDGIIGASKSSRKIIYGRPTKIGFNNLVTVLFEDRTHRLSTHNKHPFSLSAKIITYWWHICNAYMHRIGTKAAGRLLDEQEWNEMPGVRS